MLRSLAAAAVVAVGVDDMTRRYNVKWLAARNKNESWHTHARADEQANGMTHARSPPPQSQLITANTDGHGDSSARLSLDIGERRSFLSFTVHWDGGRWIDSHGYDDGWRMVLLLVAMAGWLSSSSAGWRS